MISGWSWQQALEMLDRQCSDTLQTGYRPNTQRNYRSRANIYIRFCQIYRLCPFPVTEWNLIRYARYIANGVTAYDTVKSYLSAVKRFHELGGIEFPEQLHLLKVELMAIKKELVGPVKKAVPLTTELLLEIYKKVNLQDSMELVAYITLLIGFCLFLRRSNLVPETGTQFNPKEQLTRADVWQCGKLMLVDVRWTKNNQYRERELILPLLPARNHVICPVYWMKVLLSRFPTMDLQVPLFSYVKAGKHIPITGDYLSKKYKSWIELTGRNSDQFTLHGLRHGGTNHALTVGLCSEDIKLMGDWISLSYLQYIDLTMERRVTNMVKFIDEMDNIVEEADGWDVIQTEQGLF